MILEAKGKGEREGKGWSSSLWVEMDVDSESQNAPERLSLDNGLRFYQGRWSCIEAPAAGGREMQQTVLSAWFSTDGRIA